MLNAASEDKEITIDDEMMADWEAIQEKFKEPEEDQPVKDETKPVTDDVPRGTSEKARDESGKFVKADNAAPKEPSPDENAAPAQPEQAQPDATGRDINRAPSTWKPVVRGEWEKLPASVKAEIHRREADFQNGQSQLLPDARLGAQIRQVSQPYQMVVDAYGGQDKALQSILPTIYTLQTGSPQQKLQTIASIAQQFGVDLSPLGSPQAQAQPPQQEFRDPRFDRYLAEQQAQEHANLTRIADSWLNEKDAQGNPLRPYAGDVMNEMALLISQVKQANPLFSHTEILKEAYDRAVWANPDTRTALQAKQQSELLERQQAENQRRVADAKKSASVNVTRRASIPSPAKPGRMEDSIAETARSLGLF